MEWRNGEVRSWNVVWTKYIAMIGLIQSSLEAGYQSISFHMISVRPPLLLLDVHSLHYQPQLIEYAREFGVIMFGLPRHMIHESQTLNASVFKLLKQNWQHLCHDFIQSNPSMTITKYRFSSLLNQAWGGTINPTTILYVQGFEDRGSR